MRKLKLVEHISLDGIIEVSGGPYGDWTAPYSRKYLHIPEHANIADGYPDERLQIRWTVAETEIGANQSFKKRD